MSGARQWEDPRKVLARYSLAPKRGFSQSFLVSKRIVEAVAREAIHPQCDSVRELATAGLGTLTAALVRAGARVYAVERDRDLARLLATEFADVPEVQVVEGDAAVVDLGAFTSRRDGKIAVAGNIPYAITGAILKHLINSKAQVLQAVLMVQREVRDRLAAAPGTSGYGALTVFADLAYRTETLMHVSAAAFYPRPKVDSSVIRLTPHRTQKTAETSAFRDLVHAAFQQRRKTLRNALKAIKDNSSTSRIDAALEQAGIDGRRRGETLSVEEFARLAAAWKDVAQ